MYKVFFNDDILFLTDNIPFENSSGGEVLEIKDFKDLKTFVQSLRTLVSPWKRILYHPDMNEFLHHFKGLFKYIEAAGGLVKNQRDEVLVIFRNGKWDLPKGKIDRGEKTEIAAAREISEECGITGHKQVRYLTDTYHTYEENQQFILKRSVWFEYFYDGDETPRPQTREGITGVRWLKLTQLKMVFENTYPSIEDVFETAGIRK